MPYGIRHTKKVYLAIRGIKKTKNRLSLRGKKNAILNGKSQTAIAPDISPEHMYTGPQEEVVK